MPTFQTQFPDHALAEMGDPAQRAYWERWAAVGDARLDERSAFVAIVEAEKAWHACCIAHRVNLPSCGCGEHPAAWQAARVGRDEAGAAVAAAVGRFKEG